MSQLSFDIDEMIHTLDVANAPAWNGAPLHFTTEYFDPDELEAAFGRWVFENGHFDCLHRSHMWNPAITLGHANQHTPGHDLRIYSADLRCRCHLQFNGTASQWAQSGKCSCVGDLLTQAVCAPCNWHHIGSETDVVEAWHDHAWPGWRMLPVVPATVQRRNDQNKPSRKFAEWISDNYPIDWQIPGAPILTERGTTGTRHVPGRSPWGGFDLSASFFCN